MSDFNADAQDLLSAGIAAGDSESYSVKTPRFIGAFECIGEDGITKWKTGFQNVVTDEGKGMLLAKMFGSTSRAMDTWYLGLHVLTTNATHRLSNITASEITGYGANRPAIAFGTAYTTVASSSVSASVSFSASAALVNGAFVANAGATNATTGVLYSEGSFGTTRAIAVNDTLNMTVTITYA